MFVISLWNCFLILRHSFLPFHTDKLTTNRSLWFTYILIILIDALYLQYSISQSFPPSSHKHSKRVSSECDEAKYCCRASLLISYQEKQIKWHTLVIILFISCQLAVRRIPLLSHSFPHFLSTTEWLIQLGVHLQRINYTGKGNNNNNKSGI